MKTEKTEKAGAIILSSINRSKVALLYRGRQNDWSFPKGHVDPGENSVETMTREIREETGLVVDIIETLPPLEYVSSSGELVCTKMFLVVSKDDSKLKLEFKEDDIQWIQLNKVVKKLSYDNLINYFTKILPTINDFVISE
jgi:8-oxo-dGTP pyrophosphatase MutT (NUDIX family)